MVNRKCFPVTKEMKMIDCCGCEGCVQVCPTQAIKMIPNHEGFLYPEYISEKCIDCNLCKTKCPVINDKDNYDSMQEWYFGARHVDEDIVLKSASGGMFTYLVEMFFEKYSNGYVAGVIYDDGYKSVKHIVSNNMEDVLNMRGSKYFQSKKDDVYIQVKKLLKEGNAVLFSGTPCEVAALKLFLDKTYDNLWTVDFICKGSSSPKFLNDYIDYKEKKNKSKVSGLNMRYKWATLDSWIPQFIHLKYQSGKEYLKEFYNTELGLSFQIMQRVNCAHCNYREKDHKSEFTIGDYHGVSSYQKCYSNLGTSVLSINNLMAKSLWKDFDKTKIVFEELTKDEIYKANRNAVDIRRDVLSANLKKYEFIKAIRKSVALKEKIKMVLPVRFLRKVTVLRRKWLKN